MSAPFTLIGIIGASLVVFTVLWIFGSEAGATTAAWVLLASVAAVGLAGFAGARGCRVDVVGDVVSDVVGWCTIHRASRDDIEEIRVRRGVWRVYEMKMGDGSRRVVLGAGPVQFPAFLLPDAKDRDLAAIDAMMSDLRS